MKALIFEFVEITDQYLELTPGSSLWKWGVVPHCFNNGECLTRGEALTYRKKNHE